MNTNPKKAKKRAAKKPTYTKEQLERIEDRMDLILSTSIDAYALNPAESEIKFSEWDEIYSEWVDHEIDMTDRILTTNDFYKEIPIDPIVEPTPTEEDRILLKKRLDIEEELYKQAVIERAERLRIEESIRKFVF